MSEPPPQPVVPAGIEGLAGNFELTEDYALPINRRNVTSNTTAVSPRVLSRVDEVGGEPTSIPMPDGSSVNVGNIDLSNLNLPDLSNLDLSNLNLSNISGMQQPAAPSAPMPVPAASMPDFSNIDFSNIDLSNLNLPDLSNLDLSNLDLSNLNLSNISGMQQPAAPSDPTPVPAASMS
jgi:uncharacterized protein YjbI with pentapeptide repeats